MQDLISLFAPVRLIKLFGEFLVYLIQSLFKYWWSFILIASIISILTYKYAIGFFLSHYILFSCIGFIISAIPGLLFNLIKELKVKNYKLTTDAIIINDFIVIKGNEYIDVHIYSQDIKNKLQRQISYFRENFPSYKIPFLRILLPTHKRIFYLLKNIASLKEFLMKEIFTNEVLASLLIIKNEKSETIEFDVIHIPIPQFDVITEFTETFSNLIIKNQAFQKDYIIEVSKIFISIYATGSINLHKIEVQHKILDDNRKIMMAALDVIIDKIRPEPAFNIDSFKRGWECEFERIRCLILIEQREYTGAVRHLFNAIKVKPFHPYQSYEEFKQEYTLKNASELPNKIAEILDELNKTNEEKINTENEELILKGLEIYERRKYPEMPLFQEIITQIIKESDSTRLNDLIEEKLNQDFCESPMKEIIRGDSIKYLPAPSKEKFNEMYLERCPQVIKDYRKVLEIDSNCPYMHMKLSSVIFIYYSNMPEDEFTKKHINQSFQLMEKGIDMYAQLGINLRDS